MSWKLPDLLQRPLDFINPNKKSSQQVDSNIVDDDEDDLGIKLVQHKGTVPFRRVESTVHNFVDIALPADLDRLHRHQCNIRKWRKLKDFSKLEAEYINSARTVQQLTRNINEMELLRTRILAEDLTVFDQHLDHAKEKAKASIHEFLEIHGEELNADGSIPGALSRRKGEFNSKIIENIEHSPLENSQYKDDDNFSEKYDGNVQENEQGAGFVQLRGNRLVIQSYDAFNNGNESDILAKTDFDSPPSFAEEVDESDFQVLELDSRQQETDVEEWWEKLRKDIVDLNTVMNDFSSIVHDQGEMVDDISSNVEKAEKNIKEGTSQLRKATILKAAMFPVLGAVVGGAIGGPIGMVAGFKLGSVTTGLAAAGVTGTVIGYQGGKALKKRQEDANSFEMTEIKDNSKHMDNEENINNLNIGEG